MKVLLVSLITMISATSIAAPVCQFEFKKDVTFELIDKEKDSFSSAETEFKHEVVEGKEGVAGKEFKIKLSKHIDHYRTKLRVVSKKGDEYIAELFLARSFVTGKSVQLSTTAGLLKDFILRRGVEGNYTDEVNRTYQSKVKSSSKVPAEIYESEGISTRLDLHLKDSSKGDVLFVEVEMKNLDVYVDCKGSL